MTAARFAPIGRNRYATGAILLHWIIALAIVAQVSLAWRFGDDHSPTGFALTQLHKSIGITVLLLSLIRLGWRLVNPPPPEPPGLAVWEKVASQIVHWAFYAVMIGMPLTGWIMVSASKTQIPTLLFGVVPWPNIPGIGGLAPPAKHIWNSIGHTGHSALALGFYGLFVLHVGGALKHQFFDRDAPILPRMAPGAAPGRWWEPRLALIALAVIGAIAFGKLVNPPHPASGPPPMPTTPVRASATCRPPPSPHSWVHTSCRWPKPCRRPAESWPPPVLVGVAPVSPVPPAAMKASPSPLAQTPKASSHIGTKVLKPS